ncbi:MAG: hypothetical protein ABIE47_02085 [Pseudomonadota bacterium]
MKKSASRNNSAKGGLSKYNYTKKDGTKWVGSTISNKSGTPSHRAWTFLNLGIDRGLGKKK